MIQLKVLSSNEVKFEGEVKSLTAPGFEGEFQILPYHAPLISLLKKGKFRYLDTSNKSHEFDIEGGVLENSNNTATVLLV
jgi:F-type H+-transporting ATPase subunit epsilon